MHQLKFLTASYLIVAISLISQLAWGKDGKGRYSSFPILIPDGLEMVSDLKSSMDKKSTTSNRKELKSVLSQETLNTIMEKLKTGDPRSGISPIDLQVRDQPNIPGKINVTFTIYGKAAKFKNRGEMDTKFRLRARIYLAANPDFSAAERADITKDSVFLEIKIKNPTPLERNGVNKHRLKISDPEVLKLFAADPKSAEFDKVLSDLRENALKLKNPPNRVDAMIKVIKKLSQMHGGHEFIKPQYVVSYSRTSFSFFEKNYPVPELAPAPIKSIKNAWGLISPKEEYITKLKDVEYQFTFDSNVRAFTPLPLARIFNVNEYYSNHYRGQSVGYPPHSYSVELKEPKEVSHLRTAYRSPNHRFLYREMVSRMQKEILKGFEVNKGKASHLSGKLSEAVHQQELEDEEDFKRPVYFHADPEEVGQEVHP